MDIPPDQCEDQSTDLKPDRFKLVLHFLGGTLILLLIIGILLPALGMARRSARSMKNTTQVRGIAQCLVNFADNNNEYMPGLNSDGYLIRDVDGDNDDRMPLTSHGATVEGRFWLMLDNNNFSGDYIISPAESKTPWTTGEVSSANYSYAMLNIHSDGGALPDNQTRPDQTGRASAWKLSINPKVAIVSARARIPGGKIGNNYDKIYSVHMSEDEAWAGEVGRGDGSAAFERDSVLDTRYNDALAIEADRLFAKEQSPAPNIDKPTDPNATWDDTANALLGYTSVGYEDGDIASE